MPDLFVIPLPPPPTNRPRIVRIGTAARLAPPKPLVAWREAAAPHVYAARPSVVYTDAVLVDLVVVCKRPQRLARKRDPSGLLWAVATPDVDNSAKVVLDLMTEAAWWMDDDQVVGLSVHRFFAEKGREPRVEVHVRPALEATDRFGRSFRTLHRIIRPELNSARRKRAAEWLRRLADEVSP